LQGTNHQTLIPICIIAGAALLTSLDLILRIFNFQNLSLGSLSAVGGGLFFLVLLFKSQRRYAY
jgi:iron complex transport system permease protein